MATFLKNVSKVVAYENFNCIQGQGSREKGSNPSKPEFFQAFS